MRAPRTICGIIVAALAAIAFPAAAAATFPGHNGRIAFSANGTIYLMSPDGRHRREFAEGTDPVFAPDADRIAYVVTTDCGSRCESSRIWISKVDGTSARPVTPDNFDTPSSLNFSPNGRQIVYVDGAGRLRTIDTDGTDARRLPLRRHLDSAALSPDGRRIAFGAYTNAHHDFAVRLGVARLTGSRANLLTSGNLDGDPSWSPNGRRILFYRGCSPRPCGHGGALFTIRPNGSSLTRLGPTPGFDGDSVWSPDGRLIAEHWRNGIAIRRKRPGGRSHVIASGVGLIEGLDWAPRPGSTHRPHHKSGAFRRLARR